MLYSISTLHYDGSLKYTNANQWFSNQPLKDASSERNFWAGYYFYFFNK